ncbi:MAG: substrate-binding domain-containing protein [Lachnospiraceae bacterium]|jgi:ribose transport system substrate-binding protein|uniref:substrate-binding domain-containing protein n=1 Tax=Candidatus Merdisoma sp. JLR.KK006 TaxID=3112626 RepID=UPI002FF3510A|nr:substrate-binding domain-containing protein [Lachnospiraceae bacterium]
MRNHKQRLLLAGVLLAATLVSGGWYLQRQNYSSEPLQIVLIQKAVDDTDFWTCIYEGGHMAADELGVELTVMGPRQESDSQLQHQMILEAIEQKPDAIALTPSSFEETIPYAEQIEAAGITLVLMDSTMEKEMGVSLIATDNFEAGYKMGSYMSQFVDADTLIGVVGHVKGTSTATERESGFRAGLKDAQKQIAEVVFCDSSSDKAYELTCSLLEHYPDMNLIVGLNEYSAVGAARAVKDMGRSENCHMAGFDSSIEEIRLLEEGVFDAIVIQKPFNMGYLGIETAVRAARGKEVESYVDSGSELITKENMYTEENQKLLFPFFGKSTKGL